MIAIAVTVLLVATTVSPLSDPVFGADFEEDRAVISGVVDTRNDGRNSGSSSPSGASSGGASAPPVFLCSRIDTVNLGTSMLSQCVRTDGTLNGGSLSSMVDPVIDAEGNPVPPPADPVVVTASDLQSLPILRGEVEVQPSGGRALINAEVIGYSMARSHVLNATVMGSAVQVRLTPVRWQWEFVGDDRGVFTTDGPGAPYPDMTVHGIYSRVGEGRELRSTITWMGEYRVGSGPWLLVNGNATTTAVSDPFETVEAPSRLVSATLNDH